MCRAVQGPAGSRAAVVRHVDRPEGRAWGVLIGRGLRMPFGMSWDVLLGCGTRSVVIVLWRCRPPELPSKEVFQCRVRFAPSAAAAPEADSPRGPPPYPLTAHCVFGVSREDGAADTARLHLEKAMRKFLLLSLRDLPRQEPQLVPMLRVRPCPLRHADRVYSRQNASRLPLYPPPPCAVPLGGGGVGTRQGVSCAKCPRR